MDKNTIIGFVLIAITVIGFSYFSQPSEEEIKQQQEAQAAREAEQVAAQNKQFEAQVARQMEMATAAQDPTSLFHAHRQGEGQQLVLENDSVKLTFNTRGAMLESAELKGYQKNKKDNVMLLRQGAQQMQLQIETIDPRQPIRTRDFVFTQVESQEANSLTLRLQDATRGSLDVTYTLRGYVLDMSVSASAGQAFTNARDMHIAWVDTVAQQEKGYKFESRYSTLTYRDTKGDVDNLSEMGSDVQDLSEKKLDWVAFKNQFFSAVLMTDDTFRQARLSCQPLEEGSGNLKYFTARMETAFPAQMHMYLGPNNFHILQAASDQVEKDVELEEMIDFGWPIVRIINRWFILYLFDWLTGWGLPMGIVLLLLTIIVKAIVYPATKKSYISSAKMRVLKPKIEAINAKYPDQADMMQRQQETMQLYSQYGVSPMGGCLPMLIQMPIWIALFNFVPNAIELRGESFLWADDLSSYDDLLSWGTHLPFIGDHLSIFCLLFCATNIINTIWSMRQQQSQLSPEQEQQMKMMRMMMYAMPVMFFFMFNDYSSGLCYYYFLSGLTSILIMWFLRKITDDEKLLARLEAYRDKHKNDPKKMSSMAAHLEALKKMQAEQQQRNK